jgi:hypothetical protein
MRINLRVFCLRGPTSFTKSFREELQQPLLLRDTFCIGCHGPGPCQVRASSQFYGHDNSKGALLHLTIGSLFNWVLNWGTTLLFSRNTGTDLAEPRSVAPRSQSVNTFEN